MAYDAVRGALALAKFKKLGLKHQALPDAPADQEADAESGRVPKAPVAPRPEVFAVDPLIRQPQAPGASVAAAPSVPAPVSTAKRTRRKLKDIPAAPPPAPAEQDSETAPEEVSFVTPPEDPEAEAPGEFDKDPLLDPQP